MQNKKQLTGVGLTLVAFAFVILIHFTEANAQVWNSDIGSNTIWNWQISNIYQIHQVHVGDRVYVTNDEATIHSIRGMDTSGDVFQSGAIQPNQQYELVFAWSGNFTFYDEYDSHNFGVIHIYEKNEAFPSISNATTNRASYGGSTYYNGTLASDDSDSGSVSFGTSSSTQVTFDTSNNTQIVPPVSNTTQTVVQNSTILNPTQANDTVAYWKGQSMMWQNKYENLVGSLKSLLGI